MNKFLKHFIKSFAWYVVSISIIVAVLLGIGTALDVDITSRAFVLYSAVIGVCSIVCFYSLLVYGRTDGKATPDYINNLDIYLEKRSGRARDKTAEFLLYRAEKDKEADIKDAEFTLGISEKEIRELGKPKREKWTLSERLLIRRIQKRKYFRAYPKNPNLVLNVLAKGKRWNKKLDVNADTNFIRRKSIQKIIITVILSCFACSLTAALTATNAIEALIRICMALISIGCSVFFGYRDGFTSSSLIEKDILCMTIRLFDEMDEWLEKNNSIP